MSGQSWCEIAGKTVFSCDWFAKTGKHPVYCIHVDECSEKLFEKTIPLFGLRGYKRFQLKKQHEIKINSLERVTPFLLGTLYCQYVCDEMDGRRSRFQ
jgi:hypothetical protein